jgi:hypothetical protein
MGMSAPWLACWTRIWFRGGLDRGLLLQPDFRDRVSNLESPLAAAQSHQDVKVVVLYEAPHAHALERLRQRFRIDGALTLPVKESDIESALGACRQ